MDSYKAATIPVVEASINDQRFLLNFIMGTYLGPDVKTDFPRRSASERMAEGLPSYHETDLGSALIRLSEVESLYYYVLRNAHPTALLKSQSLYLYFKGKLSPNLNFLEDERQFPDFFPPDIHKQGRFKSCFKIFKGIVLIVDPNVSYIEQADLERFKQLTGVHDLKIDRDEAKHYRHGYRTDKEESQQIPNYRRSSVETAANDVSNGNAAASGQYRNPLKRKHLSDPMQMQVPPQITVTMPIHVKPPTVETLYAKTADLAGPAMVVLTSAPRIEHWNPKTSIVLTGTAKDGRVGPPVGLVDIGISKDAYLFQVALPGVKKDQRQFSCEIEYDGKVQLQGVTTTGERAILKHSRVFQMKTQQLCPPGPFTVTFHLPGPVDPRLFKARFGSNSIFEAIVMKYREPRAFSAGQVYN